MMDDTNRGTLNLTSIIQLTSDMDLYPRLPEYETLSNTFIYQNIFLNTTITGELETLFKTATYFKILSLKEIMKLFKTLTATCFEILRSVKNINSVESTCI